MLGIKYIIIAALAGLLLGALGGGAFVHHYDDLGFQVKIDNQKQLAADELLTATNRAKAAEDQLTRATHQIEVEHDATVAKNIENLELNRRLVAARGLRDPGRRASGAGPVPVATSGVDPGVPGPAPADGRLSDEAAQFLLGESARADDAATYAADCREWSQQVKKWWRDHLANGQSLKQGTSDTP